MNLYLIQFDGDDYYVEGVSMKDAVDVWQLWQKEFNQGDGDEEPDSCALVHDGPVITRGTVGGPFRGTLGK